MKTKISRIGKKSLSVIIALMMIVSTMLVGMVSTNAATTYFTNGSTIYFNSGSSSSWWDSDSAVTYIKFVQNGTDNYSWVQMSKNSDGYYYGNVPSLGSYDKLLFVRANSSLNTNVSWDSSGNIYNNTGDITVSTVGSNNCFTLTSTTGSNITGTWSNYSGGSSTVTKYYYSYYDGSNNQYKEMTNNNGVYTFEPSSLQLGNTNGVAKFKITTSSDTSKDPANSKELCVNKNNPEVTRSTAMETAGITVQLNNDQYNDVQISNKTKEYVITFTPNSSNPLTGTINVDLKSSTPTPTTSYYIGGRFRTSTTNTFNGAAYEWNADSENIPFVETETTGIYKVETGLTVADLSGQTANSRDYFFLITAKSGTTTSYYGDSSVKGTYHSFQNYSNSSTSASLGTVSGGDDKRLIKFDDKSATTGVVTIFLDTNGGMKLWYTTDGGTVTPGTLASGTTVYVRASKEISSATLSTAFNSENQETDVAMKSAGNFNGKFYYSYNLLNDADNVTFTVNFKDTTIPSVTKSAGCEQGKNVYDVNAETWSAYEINKSKAYTSGLWVDVQPSVVNSSIALLKWSNQKENNGNDGNNYKLYIPGGVSLTLPVYSSADYVTINNTKVNDGGTFTFNTSTTYNVTIGSDSTTYNLKVYQSTSASLYTSTSEDLPTVSKGSVIEKTPYKNGSFMTVDKNGSIFDGLQTLAQIKGRGNSTWEASGMYNGKYAYNIKLNSKIDPLKMGATKAKSFCLLANNADESSLRNVLAYSTGEAAGLANTPNYEVVDVYNNGNYLGSYLITEKVDVGSSKLVDGDPVDEYHNDYTYSSTTTAEYTYNGTTKNFGYVADATVADGVNITKKSYLLEFDLDKRAKAEHCWFETPQGQYIALKTPEDLNKAEMEFIIEKWCEAENAVYNGTYADASNLIDMKSFAQVYLIQEWSKNLDSAATSYYIYYDGRQENPKWQATPIWDYDWAYGGHSGTKAITDGNEANNQLSNTEGWFAKYKKIVQNDNNILNKQNFQAKLANMTDFWNNDVKSVWDGGFYTAAKNAINALDNTYSANSASYAMNEARYGFVEKSPLDSKWGSNETGKTPEEAKTWLKNWANARLSWMANNSRLGTPTELSGVTLKASASSITLGSELTLTATASPAGVLGVTYTFYDNNTVIKTADASSNTITITPEVGGNHKYKVVASYASVEFTSDEVDVTVATVDIDNVTISSSKTAVYVNEVFTLKATASPSDLTGVKYTFYKDGKAIADATDITSNTYETKITAAESAVYTVSATLNGKTVDSATPVTVTAEIAPIDKEVTIYFKSASASAYVPSLSVDGSAPAVMTRIKKGEANSTYFGSTYSGSLKFYWFYTTMTLDTSVAHTLVFTTKDNRVNAKTSYTFSPAEDNKYYFAVNNLMGDTTLVDLTDKAEYIRNYHISATHMVYSATSDRNIGFTWTQDAQGNYTEYAMGTYLNDNNIVTASLSDLTSSSLLTIPSALTPNAMLEASSAPSFFTIKSATLAQKITAEAEEVSTLQYQLLDVNLDGKVDIKDSTMMQKALAGF